MALTFSLTLWILPLSWAVHDIEELLTMARWRRHHEPTLDAVAARLPAAQRLIAAIPTSTREFALAISIVAAVFVAGTTLGTLYPYGIGGIVYATLLGGYCLHAIVHVAQAILVRGYVPGVVTAVILIPPTSVYLYQRLFAAGILTPRIAILTAVFGVFLLVPVVVLSQTLASTITST